MLACTEYMGMPDAVRAWPHVAQRGNVAASNANSVIQAAQVQRCASRSCLRRSIVLLKVSRHVSNRQICAACAHSTAEQPGTWAAGRRWAVMMTAKCALETRMDDSMTADSTSCCGRMWRPCPCPHTLASHHWSSSPWLWTTQCACHNPFWQPHPSTLSPVCGASSLQEAQLMTKPWLCYQRVAQTRTAPDALNLNGRSVLFSRGTSLFETPAHEGSHQARCTQQKSVANHYRNIPWIARADRDWRRLKPSLGTTGSRATVIISCNMTDGRRVRGRMVEKWTGTWVSNR